MKNISKLSSKVVKLGRKIEVSFAHCCLSLLNLAYHCFDINIRTIYVIVIMAGRKLPAYTCPRCGYNTSRKGNIRNHFATKKACPPSLARIKLTDEIKEQVLLERHIAPANITSNSHNTYQVSNNTINSHNTYNNHITFMINNHQQIPIDTQMYMHSKCNNLAVTDLIRVAKEACAEIGWFDMVTDNITVGHHVIGDDACKTLFDKISNWNDNYNTATILKYPKTDAFRVFSGAEYEQCTELQTMQKIIGALRVAFFDQYEKQLILNRREHPCQHYRLRYSNILKAYYILLQSFKIDKPQNHDEEVWQEMLFQNKESKFESIYNDFASIVRVNAYSNGNKLKDMVEEFMRQMIANMWVQCAP
jgi:hypothetical protein